MENSPEITIKIEIDENKLNVYQTKIRHIQKEIEELKQLAVDIANSVKIEK